MAFKQHHVWYLVPAWGHITSAHALIVRMLQLNTSLVVTMVTHNLIKTRIEDDLSHFENLPRERLRIEFAGDAEFDPGRGPPNIANALEELTTTFYKTLSSITATTAASSTSSAPQWPVPTAVILDPYGGNMLVPHVRKIVGSEARILAHFSQAASCIYSFLAPFSESGCRDFEDAVGSIYKDEKRRQGREKREIREAVITCKNGSDEFNGTIFKVPGLKPMYDYEREAANTPPPPGMLAMLPEFIAIGANIDGAVLCSSMAVEGPAMLAMREYTKTYPVGITVAPNGWSKVLSITNSEIKGFLDKHAKNSVFFLSFGSHFFPAKNHALLLLKVFREMKLPFLLILGGPGAQAAIETPFIKEVNTSGDGWIASAWSEQKAILQHDSVGWFVGHGGWNGACEAMVQAVPMILWPLSMGDQTVVAANLSLKETGSVAFEPLQIRKGPARGVPMRGGGPIKGDDASIEKEFVDILTRAKGAEGEQMRTHVEALAKELRTERDGRGDEAIMELARV